MNIYYSDLPCGGGKTLYAVDRLTRRPQRAILAVDRREVIADRVAALKAKADQHGSHPTIIPIVSPTDAEEARGGTVRRRIAEAAETHALDRHVILIVTHAGLLTSDLSAYSGWDLVIDEVPSILEIATFSSNPCDLTFLRANYVLEAEENGAARVRFSGDWTVGDLLRSQQSSWKDFHSMAVTGGAWVESASWEEVGDRQSWGAWRVYDAARHLAAFREVVILGDSLLDHLTGQLLSRAADITLHRLNIPRASAVPVRPRSIQIEFFNNEHEGSSYRFQDPAFRPALRKVAEHIRSHAGQEHIIGLNNGGKFQLRSVFEQVGVAGLYLSPCQAGSNSYRHIHEATMIYTAKPSPDEIMILERLGLSREQVVSAREHYAVHQFLMRTSARVAESQHPLTWRVWGRACAEALKAKVEAACPFEVVIVHVDLGITAKQPTAPPKRRKQTKEEQRASRERPVAKQRGKRRLAKASSRSRANTKTDAAPA